MSDLGALSVTCEPTSLTGCNPKESLLCHRFASCLVCCAAGVIAGAKPSALFSFDPGAVLGDGGAAVGRVVDTYARLLPAYPLPAWAARVIASTSWSGAGIW